MNWRTARILGCLSILLGWSGCSGCRSSPQPTETPADDAGAATPPPVASNPPPQAPKAAPRPGQIVWHDLVTSDPAAAEAFYTNVIGWKTHRESPDYLVWITKGGQRVGGMLKLSDDLRAKKVKPYWSVAVEVDNVEATLANAQQHGANVLVQPTDGPLARFAVIGDPGGAVLTISRPPVPTMLGPKVAVGDFFGSDVWTMDGPAALRFYGDVFGWTPLSESDLGANGKYSALGGQGAFVRAGIFANAGLGPNHWMCFVLVDDLDAALGRAKAKGGKVTVAPMAVHGGRVANLVDPQGAPFGLYEESKTAGP